MATFTDNFALVKPTYGELADVAVINGNMDTVDGIMHSNRTMLAPAFSQTEDYAVGDIVVYEGNLYRFIVPHTAGNWDGTEVEQTTLGEEVSTKGGADVTKTASGNPIEISDSASAPLVKCVTQITGSQDLHGYDKPWVGGSGKNKLPMTVSGIKSTNTSGTWSGNAYTISGVTFTILTDSNDNVTGVSVNGTATENITFLLTDTNGSWMTDGTTYKINGSVGGSYNTWSIWVQGHGTHQSEMSLDGDGTFTYTAGGSTSARISVDSGVSLSNQMFRPMIRLSTETDPTFAPYSNICPITAYTEGEIEVRGKNLFDKSAVVSGIYLNSDGEKITDSNWCITDYIEINDTISYQNAGIQGNAPYACWYDSNKNFISSFKASDSGTITPPQDSAYVRFSLYAAILTSLNFQVELGSTPTTYEPYTSTTHTTTFPSAIYRGSEDVVNGEVNGTWIKESFTWGNMTNVVDRGNNIYSKQGNFSFTPVAIKESGVGHSITNVTANYAFNTKDNIHYFVNDGKIIMFLPSDTSSDTVIEIAYELATPTTSSVTPTNLPIRTLSPYTHIESTTGEMEIEYITEEYQPLVDLIQESGGDSHTYSTTEQVVGKWIDGSNVYEKTYDIGYLTSNNKTIAHGISGFGHIIQIHGYVTNDTYDFHLPHVTTDAASCVGVHADSTNIYITSYDRSDYHGYVIIQYTKSTPTRSLNLTKSAVTEEIPEEIKNAPFEEKPDVNEADDDAPTEVDER